MEHFPLLSMPKPALQAVVDALRCNPEGAGGALHGLRGTCRQLRADANALTRHVRNCVRVCAVIPSFIKHC